METENKIDVKALLQFAVRNVRGEIDDDSSVTFFLKHLRQYKMEYRESIKEVAAAVNQVFDDNRGKSLTMTSLQGFALRHLDTNADNYDNISDLVEEYVKNDPNFESKRGRGGGVRRLSDSIATEAQQTEEPAPEPLVPPIRRSSAPPARASSAPTTGTGRSSTRPAARAS